MKLILAFILGFTFKIAITELHTARWYIQEFRCFKSGIDMPESFRCAESKLDVRILGVLDYELGIGECYFEGPGKSDDLCYKLGIKKSLK